MGFNNHTINFKKLSKQNDLKRKNKTIAIAGTPNVGKSTVFNALTGMHQHTGNWPGKTVSNAIGYFTTQKNSYTLIDIPGTYSLYPHSAEEEVASEYLCFEKPDAVLVVCDATCIEKNLSLVLQIMEIHQNVMVCVNLLDEAEKKNIAIDINSLSEQLGIKVIGITAHKKKSITRLINFIDSFFEEEITTPKVCVYDRIFEEEIIRVQKEIGNTRWLAVKIIEGNEYFLKKLAEHTQSNIEQLIQINKRAKMSLEINEYDTKNIGENLVKTVVKRSKAITENAVCYLTEQRNLIDRKIDKIMTGRFTGIPIMMLMVAIVFWITISGANYLSEYLSCAVFFVEDKIASFLHYIKMPTMITNAIVYGGYRVFAWVVSVMLPPMAIFFPFFTLLEDSGYLARIAYNLDKPFYKCNACGKQALTMCMGFGCNAVGVTGARIIDSPRERLLATLTNGFMPCNGRFPMLITIISIFFVGISSGNGNTVIAALLLSLFIFLAVIITFLATKLLSKTLLKGIASSYILELPSYRKPQIGKVIIRSIFDRTLFVLGRAVVVAVPAGFFIWGLSNIYINENTLLNIFSDVLQPIGILLGLDGAILVAFILGTPANEIVIPILLMLYSSGNVLTEVSDYTVMGDILLKNGWDLKTAICMIVFTIFHWPCATTLITIKKETGHLKWVVLAALLPTLIGAIFCIIINLLFKIIV